MTKIVALTNVGGMVIGQEYEVGNSTASILVEAKYCRYASDSTKESEASLLAQDQMEKSTEETLDKEDVETIVEVLEPVKKKRR